MEQKISVEKLKEKEKEGAGREQAVTACGGRVLNILLDL